MYIYQFPMKNVIIIYCKHGLTKNKQIKLVEEKYSDRLPVIIGKASWNSDVLVVSQ